MLVIADQKPFLPTLLLGLPKAEPFHTIST